MHISFTKRYVKGLESAKYGLSYGSWLMIIEWHSHKLYNIGRENIDEGSQTTVDTYLMSHTKKSPSVETLIPCLVHLPIESTVSYVVFMIYLMGAHIQGRI